MKRLCMAVLAGSLLACGSAPTDPPADAADEMSARVKKYATVRLSADLAGLTDHERRMIPLLIEAAEAMDRIFWKEAYGDREALLAGAPDEATRRFLEINYGPWDRLAGNEPFLEGVGPKPKGSGFYPADLTKEEFERAAAGGNAEALRSLYTLVRRNDAGELITVPYREAFAEDTQLAASKLREAAELAEDAGLKRYLELRAEALLTDDYRASDFAWMDMKDNTIELVIGPIETYEDQLYGYKATHEAFLLIKDRSWSERLARFADCLPELQRNLPVPDAYKQEEPGTDSDLNAYDVIYYAGDCNAGSKTIAINLPNDEQVQLQKGTRRLQLKNAMRAKFDQIVIPIADTLLDAEQRSHIDFDAFFANVMFHEVAHGLGIKNTLTDRGTVRQSLKDQASALEEAKADVLGLYMITQLIAKGELPEAELHDNYVTFMASTLRSIRFGQASAHGRANQLEFNFLLEAGAFVRDEQSGRYRVDFEKMGPALDALAGRILTVQGDGDYDGVVAWRMEQGQMTDQLRADLDRLAALGIPSDIIFEQGLAVLGLE